MKILYFLCIFFFLLFNSAIAQNYYLHRNQRITFTEDTATNLVCYFNKAQGRGINIRLDSIVNLNKNIHVQQLRKNQFILHNKGISVSTIRSTYKHAYFSKLYLDSQKNEVFFLPQIILKLKKGNSLQKLLNEFESQLVLQNNNNGICEFSCNVKNSDELLNLLDRIYISKSFKTTIDWCEPKFYSKINFFDDPLYSQQYYLKNIGQMGGTPGIDINVEPSWNITKGSPNIKIAVVGAGVEAHEDLDTNLLPGYTVGGGTGAPTTSAHGEACAGIIAALHNNIGIKGIAPNCKIVPVNIAPYSVFASNFEIAVALNWAWHHADILSCSWGNIEPSSYVDAAIDSARVFGRNGKGCPVIFASGNDNPYRNVPYPNNYNGVITVGAIDKNGNIWYYSDRGPSMDFVAPSGDVNDNGDVVTLDLMGSKGKNSGNYVYNFGGTSAACPQVAGVVALMLSANPYLTENRIDTILQQTAIDMGSSGFDNTYGYGRVNAYNAVEAVLPYITTSSSLVCTTGATFTLNDRPSGTTVNWTHSSNLEYVSGQGTDNYVVKAASSTTSGMGWVKAVVSSSCGNDTIEKNVWVGKPATPTIICPYTKVGLNSLIEVNAVGPGAESYNWTVGGGTITSGQGTSDIWIMTSSHCLYDLTIRLTTSNVCGNSAQAMKSIPFDCSGGGGGVLLSPNPADNILTVEINNNNTSDNLNNINFKTSELRVYDKMMNLKMKKTFKGTKTKINVRNLKQGVYILQIISGNKNYKKEIMVSHH